MNSLVQPWLTLTLMGVVAALPAAAQTEADALRYSQIQSTGTSRTQAMGGAASSLGADLGAFVLNPANLGAYRRSEFSISPGLLLTSSSSSVLGNAGTTPADRSGLNFSNLGFVLASRRADDDASSGWRSGNLGINFSRLNTFSANRRYRRTRPATDNTSVIDFLVERPFTKAGLEDNYAASKVNDFADLAYGTYIINFPPGQANTFFTPKVRGTVTQQEQTQLRGAQNQIDIGYGASYQDKLYLGASLGITTVRFKQNRVLTETNDSITSDLKQLTMTDGYEVSGGGLNLRIGAVYKPIEVLRLGLAIQTPTWYGQLKEQDNPITLQTQFNRLFPFSTGQNNVTSASASIVANSYQYAVTTPFRATAGVTLIGGKAGLLSADVDYVNYGAASLSAANNDGGDFSAVNKTIRDVYRSVLNYRVGGELRLAQIFRLRAGYAFYASPYTNTDTKGERTVISAGAGIRRESFYLDLGLARTEFEQPYSPYRLGNRLGPVVNTKYTLWNPTVTLGFVIQ